MLGSSASVADPNIVLNTIVAEEFSEAAEKLEKSKNFEKDCKAYTEKLLKAHYRVIFNYNGYGPEWEPEAERRGLLNNKNTADAVPELFKKENIDVFVNQGVYTKSEAIARARIQLENYIKTIRIEALTMLDMAKKQIYPAVSAYVGELVRQSRREKGGLRLHSLRVRRSAHQNPGYGKRQHDGGGAEAGKRPCGYARRGNGSLAENGARRRSRHGTDPRLCRRNGKTLREGLLAFPHLCRSLVQRQLKVSSFKGAERKALSLKLLRRRLP